MKDWKEIPMPEPIKALERDPERGYPVPYFVAQAGGKYDFRIADNAKRHQCVTRRRCWICGEPLGKWLAAAKLLPLD